jgi:colanic acid biosynthesis glycosyl transferase WcaI
VSTPAGRRLLVVTQYYWPEDFSAGVYIPELCEALAARGWTVEVVTGMPNYPDGVIRDGYRGRRDLVEERRGVRIRRRRFHSAARGDGAIRRGLSALSFELTARRESRRAAPPDVVLGFSPPVFMGRAAVAAARRVRVPLVLNVKDLFTGSIVAAGLVRPGVLTSVLTRLEARLYRSADVVVTPARSFVEAVSAMGVPADRVRVIPDWADGSAIRPASRRTALREAWGLGDRIVVVYSGSLGYSSALEPVLEAADRLRDDPRLAFVIVGDGVKRESLERLAADRRLPNVSFFGLQPRERVPEVLATADLTLVTLSSGGGRVSTQGKLYTQLAAGRPVLAVVPRATDTWAIVEGSGAGWCVEPQDIEGLTSVLRRLVEEPDLTQRTGAEARRLFEVGFSLEAAADAFDRVLASVAGRTR